MGRKQKLRRFAEIRTFPNVYECHDMKRPVLTGMGGTVANLQGLWQSDHFKNGNPITLELACGGGEYTVALARKYPERNFIGIDIKGNRLWQGAKIALDEGLANVAFLRTRIEILELFFAPKEIAEIWITFCDPFVSPPRFNRRLTSPRFLQKYRQLLKPNGLVHLKHDNEEFYQYTLDILAEDTNAKYLYSNDNIYAQDLHLPELAIRTYYESMHLADGRKIKYIQFQL